MYWVGVPSMWLRCASIVDRSPLMEIERPCSRNRLYHHLPNIFYPQARETYQHSWMMPCETGAHTPLTAWQRFPFPPHIHVHVLLFQTQLSCGYPRPKQAKHTLLSLRKTYIQIAQKMTLLGLHPKSHSSPGLPLRLPYHHAPVKTL